MREEERFELEVHVAGICLRKEEEYEILIARRSDKRKLYPGLWECGGGQVEPGENFEEAVKRQLKEELGVIIDVIVPIGTYEIKTPDLPQKRIPGIHYLCEVISFVDKEPKVDGKELTEWKWLPFSKLEKVDFIPDLPSEIREAVKLHKLFKS